MLKSICALGLTGMLLLISVCADADSESNRRLALVIGNANYGTKAGQLENASNDAIDVAHALKKLGFEVMLILNADLMTMKAAIERFSQEANHSDVVFFYYAGFAHQIKSRPYIIPIGSDTERAFDEPDENALKLDDIFVQMKTRSRTVNLVVIDACGLLVDDWPVQSLIAFSSQPGKQALDSTGVKSRNSPYTQSLLRHIVEPGITIEELFKRVRKDVRRVTEGKQVPWEYSTLEKNFYFTK